MHEGVTVQCDASEKGVGVTLPKWATCGICLKDTVSGRTTVCPDREGMPGHRLLLSQVQPVHHKKRNHHCRDWPEAHTFHLQEVFTICSEQITKNTPTVHLQELFTICSEQITKNAAATSKVQPILQRYNLEARFSNIRSWPSLKSIPKTDKGPAARWLSSICAEAGGN